MNEAEALLNKISTLRQRLEQVRGLVNQAGSAIAAMAGDDQQPTEQLRLVERQIRTASQHGLLLDDSFRQWQGSAQGECLPSQWTARARRLLELGRDLLRRQRSLADAFDFTAQYRRATGSIVHPAEFAESDPLADNFRDTVAMTDTTIRLMATLPNSPSGQLRLCPGLEAIFEAIARRVDSLAASMAMRRRECNRIDTLAELLVGMEQEKPPSIRHFEDLAECLFVEAREGALLRFLRADAYNPGRFVACHSLVVAQVLARLINHDCLLRGQQRDLMLAALVHDVGMLRVPVEVLSRSGPLTDAQKRTVEEHTRTGAELIARLLPTENWLSNAAATHHERINGTGYPAGLTGHELPPSSCLLAVCDVYAAQCSSRPQRPAKDTRTALTDTLLMAEKGALDQSHAERLLALSFYPVGSVVELADGAIAIVVAVPADHRDLEAVRRPALALLMDAQGQPLSVPQPLNLAECQGRAILRSLPPRQRATLLSKWYPELAA
jgi:HD-GYP domain-containing protein (c-di-GMP phosphodiesterase class II)